MQLKPANIASDWSYDGLPPNDQWHAILLGKQRKKEKERMRERERERVVTWSEAATHEFSIRWLTGRREKGENNSLQYSLCMRTRFGLDSKKEIWVEVEAEKCSLQYISSIKGTRLNFVSLLLFFLFLLWEH